MGTKAQASIEGVGSVYIEVNIDGKASEIKLLDVLYVPDFAYQLVFVG